MRSSWDGSSNPHEDHKDPHFTLLIFPDGRTILSTPSNVRYEEFEKIREIYHEWANNKKASPLVIGNCVVELMSVAPDAAKVDVIMGPLRAEAFAREGRA